MRGRESGRKISSSNWRSCKRYSCRKHIHIAWYVWNLILLKLSIMDVYLSTTHTKQVTYLLRYYHSSPGPWHQTKSYSESKYTNIFVLYTLWWLSQTGNEWVERRRGQRWIAYCSTAFTWCQKFAELKDWWLDWSKKSAWEKWCQAAWMLPLFVWSLDSFMAAAS